MKNFRTACLAISLLSPAPIYAACANSSEPAWDRVATHLLWVMVAPYFFPVLVCAFITSALILFGGIEGRKDQQRYSIIGATITLLTSATLMYAVLR